MALGASPALVVHPTNSGRDASGVTGAGLMGGTGPIGGTGVKGCAGFIFAVFVVILL